MAVSATEIEKLESSGKGARRVRYTEEFRLEAIQYYKKGATRSRRVQFGTLGEEV